MLRPVGERDGVLMEAPVVDALQPSVVAPRSAPEFDASLFAADDALAYVMWDFVPQRTAPQTRSAPVPPAAVRTSKRNRSSAR